MSSTSVVLQKLGYNVRRITHVGSTQSANTQNINTKILEYTVPNARKAVIPAFALLKGASYSGLEAIIDLRTAAGVKLSGSSKVSLTYQTPSMQDPVIFASFTLGGYADLDSGKQREADNQATLLGSIQIKPEHVDSNTNSLKLPEGSKVCVFVEASAVASWATSAFELMAGEVGVS